MGKLSLDKETGATVYDPKRQKNLCAKTRPKSDPYETWVAGNWTWQVLKKWQVDDAKPYARWFCNVITPMCPDGEMGDVYVAEIKRSAVKLTYGTGV